VGRRDPPGHHELAGQPDVDERRRRKGEGGERGENEDGGKATVDHSGDVSLLAP